MPNAQVYATCLNHGNTDILKGKAMITDKKVKRGNKFAYAVCAHVCALSFFVALHPPSTTAIPPCDFSLFLPYHQLLKPMNHPPNQVKVRNKVKGIDLTGLALRIDVGPYAHIWKVKESPALRKIGRPRADGSRSAVIWPSFDLKGGKDRVFYIRGRVNTVVQELDVWVTTQATLYETNVADMPYCPLAITNLTTSIKHNVKAPTYGIKRTKQAEKRQGM